ncbi:MAG: branched-chain amino acid aminotransferase [Eubacteriales bacterium]|nr:branched-chain amino acid aminotransferase [Eubacteriales bacterium]
MKKKDIDWGNIPFDYMVTDYRYVSMYEDGKWDDGVLTGDATIKLSECAGVLQYAQEVFEGLKAYETVDGKIVTVRPDLNAERIYNSAIRLEMPPFPKERFIDAVEQVVRANAAWVPPYGSGATLYIRPFEFGFDSVIGVKPSDVYQFRMFTTPVGPYFKGRVRPIAVKITDYDRAAPHGTGGIKAALNYAMSLKAIMEAHREGYSENFYLDPATRTYIQETGGANIIFITKDHKFVTPKSDSILPSVTRRSLEVVAKDYMGMEVEERPVALAEVPDFVEVGVCGTAAVIAPVGEIHDHGNVIHVPSGMDEIGPVLKEMRETLTGIQMGTIKAPEGWIHEVKVED